MADAARDAWVARVLGVSVPGVGAVEAAGAATEAAAGAAARTAAGVPGLVKMQKARLLWGVAHKKILSEVDALKAGIVGTVLSPAHAADVARALHELDAIPAALDGRLADALDAALQETEPVRHAELVKEARATIDAYSAFVEGNELIPRLSGTTPFKVNLTIAQTAVSTLKALRASL